MKLLITDLDNTLYDWVTYFANSFQAMVRALANTLSVSEEKLLDEFKGVHQRYGNSEHPFAILELPSVRERFSDLSRAELLEALRVPLDIFNNVRDERLRLYPGVRETLEVLRKEHVLVVGHTEAIAVNAYSRLRKLGVVEYFHHLYALEAQLEPHPDPNREVARQPPPGLISLVPSRERKPNPALLIDICKKEGIHLSEACYIGDSLTRDVSMAKGAGVTAVWARYGTQYNRELWDILVRVTHWTDEDVKREAELRTLSKHVQPDYTIDRFADLLKLLSLEDNHLNIQAELV
jgi:phosphoglycolate phosphatase